jgi:hypothetical protein
MTNPNLTVTSQGKAVVEQGDNGDWLVMFPDGHVQHVRDMQEGMKLAERWFTKDHRKRKLAIGVGIAEGRPNSSR